MSADISSAATERKHHYLPERCELLPGCDKAHAGPESLDSFPLFLPAKRPAESAMTAHIFEALTTALLSQL